MTFSDQSEKSENRGTQQASYKKQGRGRIKLAVQSLDPGLRPVEGPVLWNFTDSFFTEKFADLFSP